MSMDNPPPLIKDNGCPLKILFLLTVIYFFCIYKNNPKGLKPFMESALFFSFFNF